MSDILEEVTSSEYKYGFTTDIEMDTAPMGLSEDIVRFISLKKNEPLSRHSQSHLHTCLYKNLSQG